MKVDESFYNRQYASMKNSEANAVDHAWYRPLLKFAKTRNKVVCDLLKEKHFDQVLELGCGTFELAERLDPQCAHYTVLDISSYRLNQAPEFIKNNPKFSLQHHDANQPLQFQDNYFDAVICISLIEYLFDPKMFVRELHRVLKPEGVLILNTGNLAFLPRRLQLLFGQLPTFNKAAGWQGGILHDFTYPTLERLLERSHLTVITRRCAGLWPELRMWWPNLLAGDMTFYCRKK